MAYEDELAAYDASAARTFGRQVPDSTRAGGAVSESSRPWRTGEPGVISVAEYDLMSAVTFGRYDPAQEAEVRRQVDETARQLAAEREVLERARRLGWETALMATPAADRAVAESVRARSGGAAGQPGRLREASATPGGKRTEVREVIGWTPKPYRAAR